MFNLPAVSGRVYFPACSPSTVLPTANTFYAHPLQCPPRARIFDSIGMRITSAGVGVENAVRLAIYTAAMAVLAISSTTSARSRD
jgi:hypothetical protein